MTVNKIMLLGVALLFFFTGCTQQDKYQVKKQADAARNLGEAYMAESSYPEALKELLKADRLDPKNPYTHNDLGLVYMGLERPEHAIGMFKKAIALNPDYVSAKNNLGSAYLMKKDWDSAIKILEKIAGNLLYASPQYPLSNLGWAYYNKREYPIAKKYYSDALKRKPLFFPALLGLGRTYLAMGRIFDAKSEFLKAKTINPDNPELLFELGRIYRLSGDYIKARKNLNNAISKTQDSTLVEKAISEIKRLKLLQ